RTEYDAIRAALLANNGNISATARNVGISRQTLYRKLKQFGLEELTSGHE
ncbi:MAG: helix-turn-helix domain-containing protein, partial [Noviherbaspirillum sp.]